MLAQQIEEGVEEFVGAVAHRAVARQAVCLKYAHHIVEHGRKERADNLLAVGRWGVVAQHRAHKLRYIVDICRLLRLYLYTRLIQEAVIYRYEVLGIYVYAVEILT